MKECSKSIMRRLANADFSNKYFVGRGLDIGGKPDPLGLYSTLFTRITSVRTWDWEDGDAQFLEGVRDEEYDFVHSSHCLEHLVDPTVGLTNWLRVTKQNGYLVVTVPDEDLYEQGVFPSTFNHDHKWTFTICKSQSWSSKSINIVDLAKGLGNAAELVRIELLSATYRFELPRFDQTLTPVAECGIEFVFRKRTDQEIADMGKWRRPEVQPTPEVRTHLNQYRDDLQTLKSSNISRPPFSNDTPI